METDANVVPSERHITTYLCPNGHTSSSPSPSRPNPAHLGVPVWCGRPRPVGGTVPEAKQVKHQRTHCTLL